MDLLGGRIQSLRVCNFEYLGKARVGVFCTMLKELHDCFGHVIDSYLQRMERKLNQMEDAQDKAVSKQRLEQLRLTAMEMKENIVSRLVQNQEFWALDENSPGAHEQREILQAKANASTALEELEQRDLQRCRELEVLYAEQRREEKELTIEIQRR